MIRNRIIKFCKQSHIGMIGPLFCHILGRILRTVLLILFCLLFVVIVLFLCRHLYCARYHQKTHCNAEDSFHDQLKFILLTWFTVADTNIKLHIAKL